MRRLVPFASFALACSSTAESTTIHVSDYSRACVVPADCVLAIDGDVCNVCPGSAVAKSDTKYATDRAALFERCSTAKTAGRGDCQGFITTCTAGVCGAVACENPSDAGTCAP